MRRVLLLLLIPLTLLVLVVVGFAGYLGWSLLTARVDTVGEVAFDRPPAVPPLAESRTVDGTRVFDLTMQEGESDFGRSGPTPTWGFNGAYLGPTLRAARGELVRVQVTNRLGESSTVHWHGMHLPAAMDGGPHQPIAPGQTWSPTWRVDQPAATLWYHPHPHGDTAEQVYRGLAGMFLVDDPRGPRLPSSYGVDDVPVIVQDKAFDGSELDTSHGLFQSTGLLGDQILVNGTPGPYLEVTTERVRLRLLNASNARIFDFAFDDSRGYDVIASDGGLLPHPVRRSHLELSPGERAEIVVSVAPGERPVLRSGPIPGVDNVFAGTKDSFDILQLRAADHLRANATVPATLAPAPDLADDHLVASRNFELSGESVNGRHMDMGRVDVTATLDTTEEWTVRNTDGQPHNFHVHDVQFQVKSVDRSAPPAELAGWKDTVFLPPGREVVLRLHLADYADPHAAYMFHCHLLRHEDSGMMGQFVVVDPDDPTRPHLGTGTEHDH